MNSSQFPELKDRPWNGVQGVPSVTWTCGYCNHEVGSNAGFSCTTQNGTAYIRICSVCGGPTFFAVSGQHAPEALPGGPVEHVPADLANLYHEGRAAAGAGAHTAAVLVCRKMLMNIAVTQKAKEGLKFIEYVEYLADNGYVPPNGKGWVDYIRTRGNEATHEIAVMDEGDSKALILFVGMLLKFIYELPSSVPAVPPSASSS